jgi:hypothetical protein
MEQKKTLMRVGILLKRKPLLTKLLSPLEYHYLSAKNNQFNLDSKAFSNDFYFKKGSVGMERWESVNGTAKSDHNSTTKQLHQPADPEYLAWVESLENENENDSFENVYRKPRENLYYFTLANRQPRLPNLPIKSLLLHETVQEYLDSVKVNGWVCSNRVVGVFDNVFFIKVHLLDLDNVHPSATTTTDKKKDSAARELEQVGFGTKSGLGVGHWLTRDELQQVDSEYFDGIGAFL